MTRPVIPVAAGCLVNPRGEVLICRRPEGKLAAGKWEFPGGKIEAGENGEQALRRELREELGIALTRLRPLIRVRHDYSDRTVVLDTWRVDGWQGVLQALDNQGFDWLLPARLHERDLLAADVPIVRALCLPDQYVFTPPQAEVATLRAGLAGLPKRALLRLRLPSLDDAAYEALARVLLPECQALGLRVLLDRAPAMVAALGADGWHATSSALARLRERPEVPLLAASCHSRVEIEQARRLGVDCAVLGPVGATATHPGANPIGWEGFDADAWEAGLPVYAIGGVGPEALAPAWEHGGQGVAGISAWWGR